MQKLTDNIYLLVITAMGGTFILVISFSLLLLRNRNKLLRQKERLRAAELEHQKELLQAVIESQEEERQRIGRDLHDHVGAALATLRIIIERFVREPYSDEQLYYLKTATAGTVAQIIKDVRHISHNLSPEILTLNSFHEAIEELCDRVNDAGNLKLHFSNSAGELCCRLPYTAALALYRVLEELVTNTIKHAFASQAEICFTEEPDILVLDYRDNGIGLPEVEKGKKGRGMKNIESRLNMIKAACHVYPNTGTGYAASIRVPLLQSH